MINLNEIDTTWTLFLDRDGVINHEKHLDYVHHWEEFVFYEGAKEAIQVFSSIFNRIIIVTNQKGVGKGLTKLKDLMVIHENLIKEVNSSGGKIDSVYFCPDLNEDSPNRKPNPGMGWQAKQEFPEIVFEKSIMVGNTLSDMGFGKNLNMKNVFLTTTHPDVDRNNPNIDMFFDSLFEFATILRKATIVK